MKILFLSHYFPPEVNAPAYRTYDHCKEWVRLGHEVTVITCFPNHPAGEIFEGYQNRWRQEETRDGIRLIRVWTYPTPNAGIFLRALNHIVFMLLGFWAAMRAPRHDVLVTTSPQFFNGLVGLPIRWFKRIPWVLEIRDLWPESIVAVGAIKNRFVIGILEWLEGVMYRNADAIIVVTRTFRDVIAKRGIPPERISFVPNGVDLALFEPTGPDRELLKANGLEGKFVATYAGTLGMAHGLGHMLEAAAMLKDRPDIAILIVGDGAEREQLAAQRERLGLDNVKMVGLQPKEKLPGIWAASNVALVPMRATEVFKTILPSKIFEIMAMGVPFIMGIEGEAIGLVTGSNAGIAVPPGDAKALADAIRTLADDKERCRAMARNGRDYAAAHFDRRKLARDLLRQLEAQARGRAIAPSPSGATG
ncbi:MAG: glycosyltransferase family 4 protein [Alphaproteobacteria bacterium]|nr:glycosyltransferase family 4 protein [Alphaproteobacteria bacterium]